MFDGVAPSNTLHYVVTIACTRTRGGLRCVLRNLDRLLVSSPMFVDIYCLCSATPSGLKTLQQPHPFGVLPSFVSLNSTRFFAVCVCCLCALCSKRLCAHQ